MPRGSNLLALWSAIWITAIGTAFNPAQLATRLVQQSVQLFHMCVGAAMGFIGGPAAHFLGELKHIGQFIDSLPALAFSCFV